jgi:O-antigen/teichoic acid export membrane protein
MREIGLILFVILVPTMSKAAGLMTLIEKADSRAVTIVLVVFGIIALGVLGAVSEWLLTNLLGRNKQGKMAEKACYVGSFTLLLGLIMNCVNMVTNFIFS